MGEALNVFLRHAEGLGSASFFAFLLTALVLLGLWSGFGQSPLADLLKGPSARQLFLTVPMHLSAPEGKAQPGLRKKPLPADFSCFVTTLSTHRLTFISPRQLATGVKLTVDLKALPDFPEAAGGFEVTVDRSEALNGKSGSFLVEASFGPLAAEQKTPLLSYLKRLVGPSRLALG